MLTILTEPNPLLHQVCKPIEQITPEVIERAREMLELMYKGEGIGLAAPQVGWDARLFVINHNYTDEAEGVFINPVLELSPEEEFETEGCLSLPGIFRPVRRAKVVRVSGTYFSGRHLRKASPRPLVLERREYKGLRARCIQHETAHLDGILITDMPMPTYPSSAA